MIQEYMKKRGFVDSAAKVAEIKASGFQAYAKPPADEGMVVAAKKQSRPSKDINSTVIHGNQTENGSRGASKGNSSVPKKKKGGKTVTLAEAAKGSVVFQQGKPCSCQARRHKLVSNCLSCGKIICEQEGEGPCSFCGVLVLREGSTYAGLSDPGVPLSEAEAAAEAYAKRLVDYDRNSTARTKVIDDQSDYYEIEGNSWLSTEVLFFKPSIFHVLIASSFFKIVLFFKLLLFPDYNKILVLELCSKINNQQVVVGSPFS